MRVRLPLYVKILGWFFLNVAALVIVFAVLFNGQFRFNLDWFLGNSGAQVRIQKVRDEVMTALESNELLYWPSELARISTAHDVSLSLLDNEGNYLVGEPREFPKAVHDRISSARFPIRRPPSRNEGETTPVPMSATPAASSPRAIRRGGPPLHVLMRTTEPTEYWLMTSARLERDAMSPEAWQFVNGDAAPSLPGQGPPPEARVILVARSSSLSGGGLIFDPTPWLLLAAGATVFSLGLWLPLVRGITRFIAQTTQATRRIAAGRFDVRVKTRRYDELGELGTAINQMAAQLDHLVGGQKRFLGDVAHELCSPLAHLQMTLAILEQRAQRGEERYVKSAVAKAAEIANLVNELLSFSKASIGAAAVELQPVNVSEAMSAALQRELGDLAAEQAEVRIPNDLAVASDRDLFIRAVGNVLRNAARHAAGTPISIHAERSGSDVIISIADSGPGVPEEDLSRIFDAFYRVDGSRTRDTGGTGLGLSIVKTCIETCCGSVSARNRTPTGLEVLIQLPVAEQEVAVA